MRPEGADKFVIETVICPNPGFSTVERKNLR